MSGNIVLLEEKFGIKYVFLDSLNFVLIYRDIHALLMFISMGIFLPIGVLSWKYYQAFTLHRVFNGFGVILAVSGMITGIRDLSRAIRVIFKVS
jgi:hypothetical protein